ncbi:hypothetical protein BC332_32525 [Capsicum chinense]|nr:hypothetical protein BC332_32525 [Capsicum chinense]
MRILNMIDQVWDVAILRDVVQKLQRQVHDIKWELAAVRLCYYISVGSNAEISCISYEVHDLVLSLFHQSGDAILFLVSLNGKSIDTSLNEIGMLVHLSGSNLVLSPTIWSLAKLPYVGTEGTCSIFDSDKDKPANLENLSTLSSLNLTGSVHSGDIFKWFPNLRNLEFRMDWSAAEQIYFPRLDVLNKLERVYAVFECFGRTHVHHFDFHFPSSLKEVYLDGFNLTSDALSRIGRSLPNLQKLELHRASIERGKERKMEHVTFHNLKSLELDIVSCSEGQLLLMNAFLCLKN